MKTIPQVIAMENEDDEWQIPPIPELEASQRRDTVILKRIPIELTKDGLRSMCGLYGKVLDIRQPRDAQYAFVKYESVEEVNNILRRFNDDNPLLTITVEIARDREEVPANTNNEEYEFLHRPVSIDDDNAPMRNVLDMSSRKLTDGFSDPTEIHVDSLIQGKDYRNRLLLLADPTKEFLWDSNLETNIEYETNNNRKIVHGRAILKSSSVTPTENTVPSDATKKKSFNSDLLPSILKCANCSLAADKMCKKLICCNEPQCALECHEANHKKLSESAEEVVSPKTLLSSIPSQIEAEPIGKTVKITSVINHRLIFVRPADDEQETAFVRLLCDTDKYAKDAETLKSMPSPGSLVLAKFDYYQRAMVLKRTDDTKVTVVFIDFGNVEIRDFRELKVISDELKKPKRFATKIRLSKIDYDLMNDKALKYLYNLMAHNLELTIKMTTIDGVSMAELKASDKWVNQMVNSWNIEDVKVANIKDMSCRIFYGNQFQERCGQNFEKKDMSGKEVIILNNTSAHSFVSFLDVNDSKKFLQNDQQIQNVCNYLYEDNMCYTPKTYECCVVRHKGRWYRADCLEVCFDGFVTMHFIDYGNIQLIEVNNIRPIPDALLLECFTIEANCFSDHNEINKELLVTLQKQYPVLSRHKINRMEIRKERDYMGTEIPTLYAWF